MTVGRCAASAEVARIDTSSSSLAITPPDACEARGRRDGRRCVWVRMGDGRVMGGVGDWWVVVLAQGIATGERGGRAGRATCVTVRVTCVPCAKRSSDQRGWRACSAFHSVVAGTLSERGAEEG